MGEMVVPKGSWTKHLKGEQALNVLKRIRGHNKHTYVPPSIILQNSAFYPLSVFMSLTGWAL
jgi:hypothetical protein